MNRQFCTASDAASQTIFVNIPINHYNAFLQKCEAWRDELDILKKAVVTHDLGGQGKAEILCELMHAELLRDLALSIYMPAAMYIEDSIKVANIRRV
jgi:hypothetical protein